MILKKSVLCLSILSTCALGFLSASANQPTSTATVSEKTAPSDVDSFINKLYHQIDFSKGETLRPEVFSKAMHGYLNLQSAGKLNEDRQVLSIADFSQSSTRNRLWVIDLKAKKVLFNTYVAHGQGSGMDMATNFSNQDGTHASSLGFYVTANTYTGQHGNSLRLNGMDKGFNDAALSRGIVVHAAGYVSKANIEGQGRLGRSWGCPAVSPTLAQPIINTIKDGTCLFIYYPQPSYLKTAYWLNKKIESLPGMNAPKLATPEGGNEQLALQGHADTTAASRL
jgi:hypothetical protein